MHHQRYFPDVEINFTPVLTSLFTQTTKVRSLTYKQQSNSLFLEFRLPQFPVCDLRKQSKILDSTSRNKLILVYQLQSHSPSSHFPKSGTTWSVECLELGCWPTMALGPQWSHGCSKISGASNLSTGDFRSMQHTRDLALGDRVSGIVKAPLRILLNRAAGSTS